MSANQRPPMNVYCPPGIGDIMWLLQKLFPNTDRTFNIHSWDRTTVSSPFLKGLERIENVNQFKGRFSTFSNFKNHCAKEYVKYCKMSRDQINNLNDIYLEANTFAEAGNRLENYLPNLPDIQFQLPWKTNEESTKEVSDLNTGRNSIVIYTSTIKNNKVPQHTGKWKSENWLEIIDSIIKTFPGIQIHWVGSSYDTDFKDLIHKYFSEELITYFVDKPAEFLIPLLKTSNCFISYQSGISCISMSENIPTTMFYFDNLSKLPNSLCPPTSLNNKHIYNPIFFNHIETKDIISWIEPHLIY